MRNTVEILQSKIHGIGVFAKQNIEMGEIFLVDVVDVFIDGRCPTELEKYSYPWSRGACSVPKGASRYFNHAIHPNARIHSICKRKMTKSFFALHKIYAGEEIFINYGKWADKEFRKIR